MVSLIWSVGYLVFDTWMNFTGSLIHQSWPIRNDIKSYYSSYILL